MHRELKKKHLKDIEWKETLDWCPSQMYLKFKWNGRYWIIYLRWRHSDPWSATLVESDQTYDMHLKQYDWVELDIPFYKDSEMKKLKEKAKERAISYINNL